MSFLPASQSHTTLTGKRFRVEYRLATTDMQQAAQLAQGIAHEQTVELPARLVPAGYFAGEIVGQIESQQLVDDAVHIVISYAVESVGTGFTQLLNVIYGNTSMQAGIQVVRLDLPDVILDEYAGPRFGMAGLRDMLKAPQRPLLCTALKPMGATPEQLAELAYRLALGGIDIIKDDHGLANQVFCPFEERVRLCAEAVNRANQETGYQCLYAPNVTAPYDELLARAHFAKENGAQGVLISFGLTGFDGMRLLAEDDTLALPVLAHPALSGDFVNSFGSGFAHRVLYGQLARLAGADMALFVSYGGRFPYTKAQCRGVVQGCTEPMGHLKPIFPTPAGGMTLERIPELISFYGHDVTLLIAGNLYEQSDDLTENARIFRQAVEEYSQ